MWIDFNNRNLAVKPVISLCRVDLKMLGCLDYINLVVKPTFCSLSEVTFKIYEGSNLYNAVLKPLVLEIDNFGRFQISNVKENDDGYTAYKEVTALSYEVSLNQSTLTFKDDKQYWLYNDLVPEKSILSIIEATTGWTVKHFDAGLIDEIRTLSIDNEEIYGFLAGTCAEAFKCYFVFDTMKKTISVYQREDGVYLDSGINLSFRNLVEEINVTEGSDDVVTALTIVGAEGVGINLVNPLGNNIVYDFGYFMNDEVWGMPKDLQEAVEAWQKKIDDNRQDFEDLVLEHRQYSEELLTLDGELSVMNAELQAKLDVQSVAIAANNNDALPTIKADIEEIQGKIDAKTAEINAKKSAIATVESNKSAIVISLSFDNNFTPEQYETLKYYILGAVYENENFIFTSTQTQAQQIDTAKALYNQGMKVFRKLSTPLQQFDVKVPGFLFNKDYELFTKALSLGSAINLEIKDKQWVQPRLLQAVIDYDNPENNTLVLSDSFRIIGGAYEFSDAYGDTAKASRKAAITAPLWDDPINTGFYNKVEQYISNALNLANQEIINATNQEFTLGSYGLRGKKYDEETDSYDPHQVAMTNNVIAFTDNAWQSSRAALGRITLGNTEYYGLVAEAIVGNLIAGTQLTIQSQDKSFVMDSEGVKIENADITVVSGNSRVVISPTDGFKIQKLKEGTTNTWEDVLSEDTEGKIIAKSIKLESSDIGGWTTTANGLSSPTGDYINSNGTGKLSLMTWDNEKANFNGNIYANNLYWRNGEGTPYNVFVDGTMGGSWLTDNSVGKGKLNKVWVDEIDGMIAAFDEIYADIITANILKTKYLIADTGIFSGSIIIGDEYNGSQIWSSKDNIDAQHQGIYRVHMWSAGGYDIGSGDNNGLPFIVRPQINAAGGIACQNKLSVVSDETSDDSAFEVDGLSEFKRKVRFDDEIMVRKDSSDLYGTTYQEVDIDGHHIKVVNGIIVEFT